jgi:diguanylate cyclase (GGDEF)-like protein
MTVIPLRRLVKTIAMFTALAIAILVPLGYSINRYIDDAGVVTFKANMSARRVAQFIYGYPTLWQYQRLRISEIIASPGYEELHQLVVDGTGRSIVEEGPPIAFPRLERSAPISVAGERVGILVASIDWMPALIDIGYVALASVGLACLGYFTIKLLPLRMLDHALKKLAVQDVRFEAALDNMTQGLCMLDANHRIAVLNRRFAAMFGITKPEACINAPPEQLVEAVVRTGSLSRPVGEALFLFQQSADDNTAEHCYELTDGRTVTVNRQSVEGGGWVATYEDITDRLKAEASLDHMALHDALTDLPNRRLFHVHLDRETAAVERSGGLAVLYLDLDQFKTINETLGHPVGDIILQEVAERLRGSIRDSDILARLGGDEFAVIQLHADQPAQAKVLARRLVEVVSAPYQHEGTQITLGVSVGAALAPEDGATADAILKAADLALYRAKADGRGVCRFFEPAMDAQMQARRQLELDLREALVDGEFELYYQPLIDAATGHVICFEALLRWHHKERGLVSPSEFVPLAEEIGLIIPIGEWALRTACHEAAKWPEEIKVAVNLSVVQFRSPNLVDIVRTALSTSGLAPHRLELEITESVLMHNSQTTLKILRRLHGLGLAIAMDDFGTGYSSLSYLSSFPFDKIKIDQCFVREIGSKPEALAIIRAVVHLGRALGITVTAEGVETAKQFERMRIEGCNQCQGYLFSRPRPPDEIAGLIEHFLLGRHAGIDQPLLALAQ